MLAIGTSPPTPDQPTEARQLRHLPGRPPRRRSTRKAGRGPRGGAHGPGRHSPTIPEEKGSLMACETGPVSISPPVSSTLDHMRWAGVLRCWCGGECGRSLSCLRHSGLPVLPLEVCGCLGLWILSFGSGISPFPCWVRAYYLLLVFVLHSKQS